MEVEKEICEYATKVIPPMTHPYGKHWDQPDLSEIVIGVRHAAMTKKTFEKLRDYSHSRPTGVYEGKMWRSKCNIEIGGSEFYHGKVEERHYLHWWDISEDPDKCSHHIRIILII